MDKKFRAKTSTGKIVYGSYVYNPYIDEHYIIEFCFPASHLVHTVDGSTVKQLIGKDCLGEEIYESDIVLDDEGYEWTATLENVATIEYYTKKEDDFTIAYDVNHNPLSIGDMVKFTKTENEQEFTAYGTVVSHKFVRYKNLSDETVYLPINQLLGTFEKV